MDGAISRTASLEQPEEWETHSLFESLSEAVRNSASRARLAAECTLVSGGRAAPSPQRRVPSSAAELYSALETQIDAILRRAGLAPDAA